MTPKFQDNESWLATFREGDGDAFKHVFDVFNPSLHYLALKYGLEKEEAEDIVAETFSKLWLKREGFQNGDHVAGFLHTTVRNASINLLKQKQRRTVSHTELLSILSDKEDDFFRNLVETELLRKLFPLIESLPKQCKAVFKQIYFEGASTEEAAERLGISKRNVLNQKAIAIKTLQGKLLLLAFLCWWVHTYNTDQGSDGPPSPGSAQEKAGKSQ
jgi:RNA polymerase sigma-70 factor (ECF subfamily)